MMDTQVTLSQRLDKAHDALKDANLAFEVKEAQIINNHTYDPSTKYKMLYRDDTNDELGIVGMQYSPVQNAEAFAFFDTITSKHDIKYTNVHQFNNGGIIQLTATFDKKETILPGDDIEKQIILKNGHDGMHGLNIDFMVNRLVCTNGLRANVKDAKNSFKIKHTYAIHWKMEQIIKLMDSANKYFDRFIESARVLAQKNVDTKLVNDFLDEVVGEIKEKETNKGGNNLRKKKRESILDLFATGKGNHGKTAWDLYNAVTEYYDHFHGKDENRLANKYIGNLNVKEKAWDFLVDRTASYC